MKVYRSLKPCVVGCGDSGNLMFFKKDIKMFNYNFKVVLIMCDCV